jgi:hypothetical protein
LWVDSDVREFEDLPTSLQLILQVNMYFPDAPDERPEEAVVGDSTGALVAECILTLFLPFGLGFLARSLIFLLFIRTVDYKRSGKDLSN